MKKKLDFSQPLMVLAPLAGYTDLPFRTVVKKFGADLTISEMISSNALVYKSEKTLKMIEKSPSEDPYFVQIAGNKPELVRDAVLLLNDIEGIDGIDLNCGCPAPKVFNHGSGSNLLGDLNKLEEILSTVKKYSKKQYTSAKVRLGVNEKIPVEIGKAVEACGVDFVSVHGRTRAGKYKAPVDYDAIKTMKEAVSIPVIANGDIKDFAKAKEVLEYTKANGVMIGRGAIGKPWVFYQLKHGIEDISDEKKKEIILEHYDAVIKFHGEHGAIMFRKLLHSYSKGYQGANEFRDIINRISDIKIMRDMIENFF
ncbi:tRNA dihydrouridine synthase DusB [Malaciobacter molluscorum LMG 25693]|uniref:tRNA-dihydrouridine synthase n=1 Tax=Malaciobacter molluscorum LMG 25693 TaxID=870501 RepID=A0A2G1DGH7_9BACT|nr:tRNA-dihydrouridine synthase [Malaciobacter molluscorum]AXX91513.1 tRNA-dihydrouridine synthase B [Malaciobacter molluscorum LMG 25693]PHO17605.1 tRNA dihydrouridine synthase DusB [Malaciobacter molluscorum LMG 25693]RXJ93418.1 tRNA dihydrouridine synthase DusB [Malaciobacter molluscorum]